MQNENEYLFKLRKKELDPKRMKQLREVLKFIKNNPYQEEITLGAFISMLMDEVRETTFTMTESIKKWLADKSYRNCGYIVGAYIKVFFYIFFSGLIRTSKFEVTLSLFCVFTNNKVA